MDLFAIIIHVKDIAELCNGSTADSDSVCEGSNPSSAATMKDLEPVCAPGPFIFEFFCV